MDNNNKTDDTINVKRSPHRSEMINIFNTLITSKRIYIMMVFLIIGLLLLFVSFILPWYGFQQITDRFDRDTGENTYHSESGFGVPISRGWGAEVYNGHTSLFSGDQNVPFIFLLTSLLVIFALVFISLFSFSIIIKIIQNEYKKPPLIFGVLAVIFCLLAPLIFMISLPSAMNADAEESDSVDTPNSFFGSTKKITNYGSRKIVTERRWGGDIGWYLAWISFLLILIAFILFYSDLRKPNNDVKE